MKKLMFSCMMFFIMIFFMGCASEGAYDEFIDIHGNLVFNFNTLTYTETQNRDILYQVGHPSFDFYLFNSRQETPMINEEDMISYQALLEKLYDLSKASNQSISHILLKTSSELRDLFEAHDQSITLNDIVVFNNLKEAIDVLKDADLLQKHIPKITYINARSLVPLTSSEIDGLELFQDYHLSFGSLGFDVWIKDHTFDSWLIELNNQGTTPDESELLLLEQSFLIIKNLTNH